MGGHQRVVSGSITNGIFIGLGVGIAIFVAGYSPWLAFLATLIIGASGFLRIATKSEQKSDLALFGGFIILIFVTLIIERSPEPLIPAIMGAVAGTIGSVFFTLIVGGSRGKNIPTYKRWGNGRE